MNLLFQTNETPVLTAGEWLLVYLIVGIGTVILLVVLFGPSSGGQKSKSSGTREELQNEVALLKDELEQSEKAIQSYQTIIGNLTTRIAKLEAEIKQLKNQ